MNSNSSRRSHASSKTSLDEPLSFGFHYGYLQAHVPPQAEIPTDMNRDQVTLEAAERQATPMKTQKTWPLRKADNPPDRILSKEEKEVQEAKIKIFVTQTYKFAGDESKEVVVDENGESRSQTQCNNTPMPANDTTAEIATEMTKILDESAKQRPERERAARFVQLWERALLPELAKILKEEIGGAYSINVRRGKAPGHRIIEVMTKKNAGEKLEAEFVSKKNEILSADLSTKTVFEFRGGTRGPCSDENGSQAWLPSYINDMLEPLINHFRHEPPRMGDSVGCVSNDCGNSATIGPTLKIDNTSYRLLNWHTFDDGRNGRNRKWSGQTPPRIDVVHPSPVDLRRLDTDRGHVTIGTTVAYSGPMYLSSRVSGSMRQGPIEEPFKVVTDWALCKTAPDETPNKIRRITVEERQNSLSGSIIATADPHLLVGDQEAVVFSTGRSSGYTEGKICETLCFSTLDDGTVTRDWVIESICPYDPLWELRGMGIPGDSGAGVIEKKTNRLLGQLWGRNFYEENESSKPRLTYFTAMSDIYDDIQERWPGCSRPTLPGEERVPDDRNHEGDSSPNGFSGPMMALCNYIAGPGFEDLAGILPSRDRRSAARRTTKARNAVGELLVKHWIIFNHAKTWPLEVSGN